MTVLSERSLPILIVYFLKRQVKDDSGCDLHCAFDMIGLQVRVDRTLRTASDLGRSTLAAKSKVDSHIASDVK
jgi:hypothetical protein